MSMDKGPIVIYGTGSAGKAAYKQFSHLNIVAFCTSIPDEQSELFGIPIISPSEIPENATVYISSIFAHDIAENLRKNGFANYKDITPLLENHHPISTVGKYFSSSFLDQSINEINFVRELLSDDTSKNVLDGIITYRKTCDPLALLPADYEQYCHPAIPYCSCNDIVTAGAYDGDTIDLFQNIVGNKSTIHAFEPDPINFNKLFSKYGRNKNVTLYSFGLYNKLMTSQFGVHLAASRVVDKKDDFFSTYINVAVMPLDEIVTSSGVDAITLDVEGAEYNALLGMKNIIAKHRPYLSVCVYHKPDDIWRIPLLLSSLCTDYDFYLGHHTQRFLETVFYACPRRR